MIYILISNFGVHETMLLTIGTVLLHSRSLEKAMAPHSRTLAWKIPWTEEPGRLQSMGSQTIRHNLGTKQQLTPKQISQEPHPTKRHQRPSYLIKM